MQTQPLEPGRLYLSLFHGRKSTDENLDRRGFDGPTIGPLEYVQVTYMCDVKFSASPAVMDRFFPDVMAEWWAKGYSNVKGPLCDWQFHIEGDLIHGLELGLAALQWKQAEAQARRDRPKKEAACRAAREHHAEVDGYTVIGILGDWTDISDNPDYRQWADLFDPQVVPRDQGEIRRGVWRVFLNRGSSASDDLEILLSDCTETAEREEIEGLTRRIIARHRQP